MINKNTVCSYCNRVHDISDDDRTICDNTVISHPLFSTAQEDAEHMEMASNYFREEIKALKNDYVIVNTLRLNDQEEVNRLRADIGVLNRELKLLRTENYRLKNHNNKQQTDDHTTDNN